MQSQNLSYQIKNEHFNIEGYDISVEVFTFENIYSLLDSKKEGNTFTSQSLAWGETEIVKSNFELTYGKNEINNTLKASAKIDGNNIRCIKFKFHNLPLGTLINSIGGEIEVTDYGFNMRYPEAWRSVTTPLWVFRTLDNKYFYIRSLATSVKEHRIYAKKIGEFMEFSLIYEEDAQHLKDEITTPIIEYGYIDNPDTIYEIHGDFIAKIYNLKPFLEREDVPNWFKNISLVVNMHMEAFTGHIFHTYESALEDIKTLTKYIPGDQILVYIPGWEGRYYYKYGNYTPDERLGGEAKLKYMVDEMHKLGCKVLAMYGINIVNRNTKDFETWGKPSECQTAGGGYFHHGSVDWEGAHHYDFDELANLNIGNPLYQDYLFNQIKNASLEYGFDGAFLDIAAYWVNDRNHHINQGVRTFANRLKTIRKDFLVAGECFYDGLGDTMPLFQSGHTDGLLHYHDSIHPKLFGKYCRNIAHLCLGDFSELSTGVHEQGQNTDVTTPLREAIIPTLCLVNNTLNNNLEDVLKVVEQAKEYKEKYNK